MTLWYLARAGGLAAMVLLSVATAFGALGSVRRGDPERRVVWQYLHRTAATTGLLLVIGHVAAVVLDARSRVSLHAVLVPLTSGYRPVAVALGTLAAYLFVLVALLGAARGRLAVSPRATAAWRGLHASAYLAWGLGVLHGFLAGTDSGTAWVRALDVVVVSLVVGALLVRVAAPRSRRSGRVVRTVRAELAR
jgi:DMSO/TMAO reductase YedYZ heme-binding membrane subunit